jgi:hypothetical protein
MGGLDILNWVKGFLLRGRSLREIELQSLLRTMGLLQFGGGIVGFLAFTVSGGLSIL